MAISVPNVTKIEAGSGTSASGTVTWTSGNALVAPAVSFTGGNTTAPTMSGGGGAWTSDASGSNASSYSGSISSNPNPSGTSATITVTDSAGGGVTAFVYEVAGLPSSGIRDATSPAVKTGSSTAASTNTLTNVTNDAVFFGVVGIDNGSSSITITGTATGWTYPAGGQEKNGASFDAGGSGYHIVSSVTTDSSTWTITSSPWIGLISVYKGASTPAGNNPPPPFPGIPQALLAM